MFATIFLSRAFSLFSSKRRRITISGKRQYLQRALLFLFLSLCSCDSNHTLEKKEKEQNAHLEKIYRKEGEYLFFYPVPEKKTLEPYAWEKP